MQLYILEACHIKLSDDTNEVFAYLIGYFTECVNKTANYAISGLSFIGEYGIHGLVQQIRIYI